MMLAMHTALLRCWCGGLATFSNRAPPLISLTRRRRVPVQLIAKIWSDKSGRVWAKWVLVRHVLGELGVVQACGESSEAFQERCRELAHKKAIVGCAGSPSCTQCACQVIACR